MKIKRDIYLKKLIDSKGNSLIKVITGLRRSGKSFLLFDIFKNYLTSHGVKKDHIIEISFDIEKNKQLRDHKKLIKYINERIKDKKQYYLLLDEIQYVKGFEPILIQYMRQPNVDVYVTGSNSKFLSVDIDTSLNGKNDPIHVYPLSFSEFKQVYKDTKTAWHNYLTYGGLPLAALKKDNKSKIDYLNRTYKELYLKDIVERHHIENIEEMEEIMKILASSIGSYTNPSNITNTIKSIKHKSIKWETISKYLDHLNKAFIVNCAERYDIKGKKYIGANRKYYFEDIGIRNACIGFRQNDIGHLLENVVYNELKLRGFNVDIGMVTNRILNPKTKKAIDQQLEIDFIANDGQNQYYFQVATSLMDEEIVQREKRPFTKSKTLIPRFILTLDNVIKHKQEDGTIVMNAIEFLLDKNII